MQATRQRLMTRAMAVVTFGIAAATCATASAGTLSLGTGIAATWNRDAQPLASPLIQVQVANAIASNDPLLYAATVGLSFVPVGGATGSLAVATVVNALTNPVFTGGIKPPVINPFPLDGYTSIAVENLSDADAPVPTLAGLFGFTLSSTDALGTFDIVVLPYAEGLSSWNNFQADEFAFINADGSPLTLGQITVSAVPEPSAIALAAVAGCLALARGVRRRRTKAAGAQIASQDV